MAVSSYGLIVDPKYIYFSESAQRALQHIKNCASDLWERPHHRYIARLALVVNRYNFELTVTIEHTLKSHLATPAHTPV